MGSVIINSCSTLDVEFVLYIIYSFILWNTFRNISPKGDVCSIFRNSKNAFENKYRHKNNTERNSKQWPFRLLGKACWNKNIFNCFRNIEIVGACHISTELLLHRTAVANFESPALSCCREGFWYFRDFAGDNLQQNAVNLIDSQCKSHEKDVIMCWRQFAHHKQPCFHVLYILVEIWKRFRDFC